MKASAKKGKKGTAPKTAMQPIVVVKCAFVLLFIRRNMLLISSHVYHFMRQTHWNRMSLVLVTTRRVLPFLNTTDIPQALPQRYTTSD